MNMKEQRNLALTRARELADRVEARDGVFSADERKSFVDALDTADRLAIEIKAAEAATARFAKIGELADDTGDGVKRYLGLRPREIAGAYVKGGGEQSFASRFDAHVGEPRAKALIGQGTAILPVPLTPSTPINDGRPAQNLLDVLPTIATSRDFAYLQQTSRVNAAAFVAPGALKPQSTYSLTGRSDHLRVLAHLSEPIDRFALEDSAALHQFVADELIFGLRLKLEAAVLNGTGVGEEFAGFDATSGHQTQAALSDPILTARAALTKVETIFGDGAGFFVFSPSDWEAIETQQTTGGAFVLTEAGASAPIDRAARRLWGQPVALSLAAPAGVGWFVAGDSAALMTDTGGIRIDWSTSGDEFQRNQLRARCEGRFALAVHRPLGLVKIDLDAG